MSCQTMRLGKEENNTYHKLILGKHLEELGHLGVNGESFSKFHDVKVALGMRPQSEGIGWSILHKAKREAIVVRVSKVEGVQRVSRFRLFGLP